MKHPLDLLCALVLCGVGSAQITTPGPVAANLGLRESSLSTPQPTEHFLSTPLQVDAGASILAGASGNGLRVTFSHELPGRLRRAHRVAVVGWPLGDGREVDLDLERRALLTPDARVVIGTESGDVPIAPPDIAFYSGSVAGDPESCVTMTAAGETIWSLIRLGGELYVTRPERRASVDLARVHVTERGASGPAASGDLCPSPRSGEAGPPPPRGSLGPTGSYRLCRIALECDFEYWQKFQDIDQALAYAYTVMGAVSSFYESDLGVRLQLPFVRIWMTADDPYSYVGGGSDGLNEFEVYWRNNHNPGQPGFVPRHLAHLMSGRGVGAYGEIGYLCDYQMGYSISGGNASGGSGELQHDVSFVGHEIGHNFNGIHTHALSPPEDQCSVGGNVTVQDCSTAPGTIMSYCHQCPGNYANILRGFGPGNIARILPHIDGSCLPAALPNVHVDSSAHGFEDGSPLFPFGTVVEGASVVAPGGTVLIQAGTYAEELILWAPMVLEAIGGTAIIGP